MSDHSQDGVPPVDADATKPQPESHRPSRMIGPYRLLQLVGEGGMGEVWLAEQTRPVRRQVAVKVIKAGMDTAQVVTRFEAERQALALMDHPAIATVYDGGSTPEGRPYFAMEYVKGEPITTYCDRQRLTTQDRLELFMQVCEGVQHAHQKGIIHRDLKPSNVLVTIPDDHPVPKIIDFGVAKATAQHLTERTLYTEMGVMIGTPEYMSPEQAEMGGLNIDTRTDVYALGVILYELLTGALPFDREELRQAGFAEIQRMIREKEPRRPSTRITQLGPASTEAAAKRHTEPRRLASELRGDLDWVTMKALEKDRRRRYQTANALAADVRHHLSNEPVSAGPPSVVYRAGKFVRRHRFGVAAVTTLALLLAAFGVTMAVQAQRIARERDRANREAERASKEAEAAKQVSDFLAGLFRVSDPAESRGRELTARAILDRGAARIDAELKRDPALQARLLMTMGDVYRNLGVLDRAEQLVGRSVEIRRTALGPEDPETLRASSLLGCIYDFEGKTEQAEHLLTTVLNAERRTLGEDHPNTLKTLVNLANLYDSQGRYEKSTPLMRESLQRRRKVLGPDHPDTLASMYNLAVAEYRSQRYTDAERVLLEVSASSARVNGTDHPNTLLAMDLLAAVYLEQKRPDEAGRLYQVVYDAKRRVLGPEHMDTLGSKLGLANVARMEGRFAEAEVLFRETLAAQDRVMGDDHPDAMATRASLATMLFAAGRFDESERLWRSLLGQMQRVLGRDHPDTANCLVGLAAIDVHRGHQDAALRLLEEAAHVDPRRAASVADDKQFASLKGDPTFEKLVAPPREK
jgi:non-specific serine/threonine protein kinase/serine/threonine-protein kinase